MGLTISNALVSNVLVQSALVAAAGLSLSSLVPARRTYRILSPGIVRSTWGVLAWLIFLLSLGDLTFVWINYSQGPDRHKEWLIGLVCLAASLFVDRKSTL